MPKIAYHKEANLRRIIRDAMAVDPLITYTSLKDLVERKYKRPVDREYIAKLAKKVNGEMMVVADREKVETRIEYMRESYRIVREELFRIAFPSENTLPHQYPKVSERIRALELIAKVDQNLIKTEMDLGLFTRHLGQLDIDHRLKPLDDDVRSKIVAAFKAWGVTPPQMRKIEAKDVLPAQTALPPHGPTIEQPSPAKPAGQPIPTVVDAGLIPTG